MKADTELPLPGAKLTAGKMPGHWLLARLGKRVLRPGGLRLTRLMLRALDISRSDAVVEFAPGLGATMRLVLDLHPAFYTGVEENEAAVNRIASSLTSIRHKRLVGSASDTGLPDESVTVVYGEAMLTMQGAAQKRQIVQEAARILKSGGRYGIHELCLVPDDLDEPIKQEIRHVLSETIRVGARPLTVCEWRALLDAKGFNVRTEVLRPMRLLNADRLIQDEGLWGAVRFAWNLCHETEARQRVVAMRRIFEKYRPHLAALMLVGIKRPEKSPRKDSAPEEEFEGDNGASYDGCKTPWDADWRRARFS
jgi:Methyltransferase domain